MVRTFCIADAGDVGEREEFRNRGDRGQYENLGTF